MRARKKGISEKGVDGQFFFADNPPMNSTEIFFFIRQLFGKEEEGYSQATGPDFLGYLYGRMRERVWEGARTAFYAASNNVDLLPLQ